jgi:3-methyladenine DNA glycosylase/8-oxoguanine DNA glycosylase
VLAFGVLEMSIHYLLKLNPIPPFDFSRTAYSHGWIVLAPNTWDKEKELMRRIHRLKSGKVVKLEIKGGGNVDTPEIFITIESSQGLSELEKEEILSAIKVMFRLDEDLAQFYAMCRRHGGKWEEVTRGLGRLLASPTVFEDTLKTICTTNIQWSGTKRMVENLVQEYGDKFPGDETLHAFPTPEGITKDAFDVFAKKTRMGYRASYAYELAEKVISGSLDLEKMRNSNLTTKELRKELLAIKGIGNYAAATMLMLLGRYNEIAVDTIFRQFVGEKYFSGKIPGDEEAKSVYSDWGEWKYLAYWSDIWLWEAEEV